MWQVAGEAGCRRQTRLTLYGCSSSNPSTMSATLPSLPGTRRLWMTAPRRRITTSIPSSFFSSNEPSMAWDGSGAMIGGR